MSNYEKDSLGNRMKEYESVTRFRLSRRTPVIIRLDGKAFHSWTRCLKTYDYSLGQTPFSTLLHDIMVEVTKGVLTRIQNAVLAYTQSDEVSILLRDWDNHETEQWFDATIQKMCSISAAQASVIFNHAFEVDNVTIDKRALFDSRVFNVPKEEVCNYFLWRQQDATRNSIQMLGQFHFSHKQMQGQNNSQIQDMLMLQKDINWNNLKTWMKRGTCVYKEKNLITERTEWIIDEEIPIFSQHRNYVERHLQPT